MVYLQKEPLILENFFLSILLRGYHMKMQKKEKKNMKHQVKGAYILFRRKAKTDRVSD